MLRMHVPSTVKCPGGRSSLSALGSSRKPHVLTWPPALSPRRGLVVSLHPPTCGQWDYKEEIARTWGYFQTVDFSAIGFNDEVTFYYDIWANFHFGFVGTV